VVTGVPAAAIRAPRRTLALWGCAFVLAAILGVPAASSLQPATAEDPSSQSVAARRAIAQATHVDPSFDLLALVSTPLGLGSVSARSTVARVERVFHADPLVAAVDSYYEDRNGALVAANGRSTLVVGLLHAASVQAQLAAADRVGRWLAGLHGVKLGGLAAVYAQGNDTARQDLLTAELLAFPLLLLITLWVFRGVVAAMLPLLIGLVTIVCAFALLRLVNEATHVSVYALNIASALGLGLAVDYSLLIISRYREEIALAGPGRGALQRTLLTAGRTVAMSALTIAGVVSSLLLFAEPSLRSIGLGAMLVAALAGLSALTILPAVLALLRWRINSLSPERWRRAAYRAAKPASTGVWWRISHLVMRRPWWIALVSVVALLSLSGPVLGLRVSQVDASDMPASSSSRQVNEAVENEYPAADNAPVFLAVRTPATATGPAALRSYVAHLRTLADVAAVEGPTRLSSRLWRVDVVPASPPLSANSERLVENIRSIHTGERVLAGGESASALDLRNSLAGRAPYALAVLMLIMTLAFTLMSGSLVLSIKAVLVSTLTITATFGAMVLVFQNGALEGLLDYRGSHTLASSTLVLIFAMAFGLATDYGVQLLSRVKEMRERGATDVEAVALGLERTGRIVTASALILCAALASLITAHHAVVKEVGFGAALALAIDATVVRALLLPSLMRILGRRDSWASPRRDGAAQAAERTSQAQAANGRAPKRSPSQHILVRSSDALAMTPYCDHGHAAICEKVAELGGNGGAREQMATAVAAFEFVRDNVLYTLGPWDRPASHTLELRRGMCTNKANLLVAMLRCAGIPAVYGVMRVSARNYFGSVGPTFLTRYMSPESTHVYAAAFLDGRWVKCDPSTDRELASRTAHFCQQTQLIEWDGARDSMDFLEPRHVYADLGLFADIDELLEKPPRQRLSERWVIFNDYLQFIRANPAFASDSALIEAYRSRRTTVGWLRYVLGRG
jgi:uncharacterized membrane protein YdfJ with MMPL/SSD domain